MRQPGGRGKTAAGQVKAVELNFLRRVGESEGEHERAQHGGLPGLRRPHYPDVPVRPPKIGGEQLPRLLVGAVHHSHRRAQRANARVPGGGQPSRRVGHDAGKQLVQAWRGAQRRQPLSRRGRPSRSWLCRESLREPEGHHIGARCRAAGSDLGRRFRARARDVGGLEPHQVRGVNLQEAVAWPGRQLVRAGHADHAARLHRGERAQRDPV